MEFPLGGYAGISLYSSSLSEHCVTEKGIELSGP